MEGLIWLENYSYTSFKIFDTYCLFGLFFIFFKEDSFLSIFVGDFFGGVQLGHTLLLYFDYDAGEYEECFERSLYLFYLFYLLTLYRTLVSYYWFCFLSISIFFLISFYSQWDPFSSNFWSFYLLPLSNLSLSFLSSYFLSRCCLKDSFAASTYLASRRSISGYDFNLKLSVTLVERFWKCLMGIHFLLLAYFKYWLYSISSCVLIYYIFL